MAASLAIALRTVFAVLSCVFAAVLIYTAATDGLLMYKEFLTPWSVAILVNFYINIFPIAAWIVYKESNWKRSVIWIPFLIVFGSVVTCLFIVVQFLKLSPQESINDPVYFVLLRKRKPDEMESKSIMSVASARVLFSLLGCLMVAALVYTIAIDGSPFRREIFTPWVLATVVDFYFHIFILSVWVAYKESNWKTAALWIILLFCFGSFTSYAYVILQLFHLSSQDPFFLVLFCSSNKGYEGLIQAEI